MPIRRAAQQSAQSIVHFVAATAAAVVADQQSTKENRGSNWQLTNGLSACAVCVCDAEWHKQL